ncbi:hypothetical protein Tco_0495897 [Tanacetum coccineum]
MTTLAEFMILSGGDNHPPMLDKDLYDSWQSRMELYMEKREHANYDVKATNIILQGLLSDVYALVNHHRIAKDLWERIQLLCKQFQVNTKFLNSLPPEWRQSRPLAPVVNHQMTPSYLNTNQSSLTQLLSLELFSPLSVSFNMDLFIPITNITQLLILPHLAITYPSALYPNAYSSTVHQDACLQPQSIPQIEYIVSTVNQQTHLAEFPQIDSSLAGRQSSFVAGTSGIRANISRTGGNNSGQQRVVKCFQTPWGSSMQGQCPKAKRKRDATMV